MNEISNSNEQVGASTDVVHLPIDKVKIDPRHRDCDETKVRELAELMRTIKLMNPITVWRTLGPDAASGEVTLVAGRHRLEAARLLEWETIPSTFIMGSERDARLAQIAENLHRAELTELERSEQVAEWVELVQQHGVSGQLVQKPQGGRPEGGLAQASRALPVSGKTPDAKRKSVDRAVKIAGISDDAKAAMKAAELDDNQSALLAVAREPSKTQIDKARELADRKRAQPTKRNAGAAPRTPADGPLPISAAENEITDEGTPEVLGIEVMDEQATSFESLKALWDSSELKSAWIEAQHSVCERFITEVLRPAQAAAS